MLPEPLNTIRKKPILSLYVFGLVLLLIGGALWWTKTSINPERVFWETVDQSLSTAAVTIQADQKNDKTSIHQTVQYSLGAKNISHSLTKLTQGNTIVRNELIGTPTADYTRYVSVKTDQKGKDGKDLDFSKVIGVWAKGQSGQNQLFSQGVLGVGLPLGGVAMPIGNLQPTQRHKLIKEIQDNVVYQTTYNKAKKQTVNGRLQYVYDVSVQPVAYATLMQHFAQTLGMHDLDSLDPNNFRGQASLKMTLTVDVRSRHLAAVEMQSTHDKQTYSAYDVPVSIGVPAKAISVTELQERLSHLQ
ncbi:MAG TPA: hypothetical protein VLF62_03945 [Candidatus Saccharimonadales bacterium]|nr:hypothetical protein [Candidatus Saccharimonadales bacterium]